jgi:hypothetical protein
MDGIRQGFRYRNVEHRSRPLKKSWAPSVVPTTRYPPLCREFTRFLSATGFEASLK